ncbi:MAG: hydroxylase [Myxococcota bacterium]
MEIHYLEIVTHDVAASCAIYAAAHGVVFGDPDPTLGGARTANLGPGGLVGVRAPMHEGETSVTRAYALVDDIERAVAAAAEAGARIIVPPMAIPGRGRCAIYVHDGIEAGLWQR